MDRYILLDLGNHPRHGDILGGQLPISDPAHSPRLDVGFNRQGFSWRDEMPHLHTRSEEYFIVLEGRLDLKVNGSLLKVEPYELVGLRANVPHQIVGGLAPITNFLLRVPGSSADKVNLRALEPSPGLDAGVIRISLRKPHRDYLLGACLPATHPNYSPCLDFTCVWGVDPAEEWRHDKLHFHGQREEYYFVLKGSLDFVIDEARVSVQGGQILGVPPGSIHKVVGGRGPVDVLFVRVPGGSDDKIVMERA